MKRERESYQIFTFRIGSYAIDSENNSPLSLAKEKNNTIYEYLINLK
jgi:hypothetical protein